jgi:adenylate kinase
LRHVNVGDLVRERGLHAGRDPAHGALLIDEASEDRIVDELEGAMSGAGGVVLEHHSVDFFPERWFDLVLVLRADTAPLFDRLTKR